MDHIIILSGISGSGKSTAIKALEDIGFFCVDNLSPVLIPTFIDLCSSSEKEINDVAIVVDIRALDIQRLANLDPILNQIKDKTKKVELVFLDSSDQTIIKRFKETRRKHPIESNGNIEDSIKKEREILARIKDRADTIIDTTDFTPHQLREFIQNVFGNRKPTLSINLYAFGFKYGLPADADIVMDVRFLPNPHFVEGLKDLTGNDFKVRNYLLSHQVTLEFLERFKDFIKFLIPRYKKEGKVYLNIAIGCTGGKHRSVAIVNELAEALKEYYPSVRYRDITKE